MTTQWKIEPLLMNKVSEAIPGSMQKLARIAGACWLVSVVGGLYAELFVRGTIIVHGNAAATATAILAREPLYRLGFLADVIGDLAYLGVTVLLYAILKPAGWVAALTSLAFGLAGCSVMAANLVTLMAPLMIAHSAGASTALTPLVQTFLRLHALGYELSIFFFSVQVAAWGRLILASLILPRIFGALFLLEAICNFAVYLDDFLGLNLVGDFDSWILLPGLFAELGTALWLFTFGVGRPRWVSSS